MFLLRSSMVALLFGLLTLPASAQLFDRMAGVDSSDATSNLPKQEASPAEPSRSSDVSRLVNYIDRTQTLSGDFEQIVYSGRGEEISSGSFRLKRPGMFDWKYTVPSVQRIISNGSKVYHYDEDLEQITVRSRSDLAGDVAMDLLVGDDALLDAFDVSVEDESTAPSVLQNTHQGLFYYRLQPKSSGDDIDDVWIVMNRDELSAVYVDSGAGQRSLIVLRHVKRNNNIATKSFHFEPPKGVDVIGD